MTVVLEISDKNKVNIIIMIIFDNINDKKMMGFFKHGLGVLWSNRATSEAGVRRSLAAGMLAGGSGRAFIYCAMPVSRMWRLSQSAANLVAWQKGLVR